MLAILFRPIGLLAPKAFEIIWFSNLSTLSVPDEGYSRNASCALNLIYTFLLYKLWLQWMIASVIRGIQLILLEVINRNTFHNKILYSRKMIFSVDFVQILPFWEAFCCHSTTFVIIESRVYKTPRVSDDYMTGLLFRPITFAGWSKN